MHEPRRPGVLEAVGRPEVNVDVEEMREEDSAAISDGLFEVAVGTLGVEADPREGGP